MTDELLKRIDESILPYLNEIGERIWSSHAAIMVGAGFSKNVKPNGKSSVDFPDWNQLGDVFFEKINGKIPDKNNNYLNVLKLADELQAAFGRPALNQVLRDVIPDIEYEPSKLHEKLLTLPWVDVFTTNYDTLLERASSSITSNKYDVVINKEDLVYSSQPRIIKLHGSFPSERPFIITEDDYRRYPKENAPFVNTVQQSLLENTLCMIGFSGEDPNFLQWIGWIRDNLGNETSSRMYLIGIFNLNSAQKKLLEQRNIVLIDMSVCCDVGKDHYKGLDLFFDYLLSLKQGNNRTEWPYDVRKIYPEWNTNKSDQINNITDLWKKQRMSYPGWIVLPEDRRSVLWESTSPWIGFLSIADDLSKINCIEFLYEFNWRLEKCLSPIYNDNISFYEYTLDNVESIPSGIDNSDTIEMIISIILSMLRFYREEGFLEKWNKTEKELISFEKYFSNEQLAALNYERCMFSLFKMDLPELKLKLKEWKNDDSLPFYDAKKAALFAEIGYLDEALQILQDSLKLVRSKLNLKPISADYSLVSQESYIMFLLLSVQRSNSLLARVYDQPKSIHLEFEERWNILKQYKCDPWNELKIFENILSGSPSVFKRRTEKNEFDLGQKTITAHLGNSNSEVNIACRFLRFCEDAGIPFRIPHINICEKSAKGVLKRLVDVSPFWAITVLLRIGDDKVVDSIYNRESISKIDLVQIDEYISYYAGILSNCLNEFVAEKSNMRSFAALLSQIVPEILSRLCIRCSIEKKYLLMDLLLQIYKSDRRTNFSGVNNLANRLIHSFSPNERLDLINKLLSFPIIDNNTLLRGNEFVNPIQFLDLSSQVVKEGQKPDIDTGRVQYFVESCRSENPGIRKWSIATLDVLYHLNLLEEDIVKAFSDCLWFKTDDTGFPSDTDYYKFAFLDLPHPESVDPVSLFRNYIKTANFPVQSKEKGAGISLTNGVDKLSKEILRGNKFIEWQGEEIQLLFSKIIEWWNADKHYLKKTDEDMLFSSVSSEFNKRFRNLMNILIFVISPNFNSNTDIIVKETLKRIIDEFRDFGLPTLRIKCAFCHVEKEMEFCIYDEIESYLTSNDRKQIIEGLQSILIIHKNDEKEMNSRFISILGQMFLWQKANCLAEVIDILTQLVKIHPDLYFTNIEKQVLIGLSNIADDNSDRFDFDTYLVIREKTAKMANTLFHLYSYNDKTIPDQILRWYERCQSDKEFPEIRNQWI